MRYPLSRFANPPVVGILRGFSPDVTVELLAAARRAGLVHLEITMDTPDAEGQIRRAIAEHGEALNIGAGTVTTQERLSQALAAGARFIVTPNLSQTIVQRCVHAGIPVFPGALSPTEIDRAWEWGATMVKVFPSDGLGPRHIARIKEILPHVALIPTGGVTVATLPDFIRAGAQAVGVGGPLFAKNLVEARDWAGIESKCRAFRDAYLAAAAVLPPDI